MRCFGAPQIHNLHEGDIREEEAATDHKTVRRFYVFANHLARETRVIRRNGKYCIGTNHSQANTSFFRRVFG